MKDIIVTFEDENIIEFTWKEKEFISKYYLEGKTNLFNYEVILETKNNKISIDKKKYNQYTHFRVAYIVESSVKETIVYTTEEIEKNIILEKIKTDIEINAIKSYEGITLSFRTSELYDKYILYEKINNTYKIILETDDFQVTSSNIKENNIYYVEAYIKEDNKYILANKSNDYRCKFKVFGKNRNKLTIGIPVYNGEMYLSRTIDSILLSTFDEFNIIIVNDGSKDNTEEVCKWYTKQYNFIKYKNKKANTGLSETRNIILEEVKTDYVALIDSDDLAHPDMYKSLYDNITNNKGDIAIAKTVIRKNINDKEVVLDVKTSEQCIIYDYEKMFLEHDNCSWNNIYFVSACNKIVKTTLAKQVKFPNSNYYEDSAYTPALYTYAKRFIFVPNALYIWEQRKRESVGTHSTTYEKLGFEKLLECYYNATIYPITHCNKIRKKYMEYDAIKQLFEYYEKLKDFDSEAIRNYKEKIRMLINYYDIENNQLIVNKIDLYEKLINL